MYAKSFNEINKELLPVFQNPPYNYSSSKANIMNLINHKMVDELDVAIVNMLYNFKYATLEQMSLYLDSSIEDIQKRLPLLIKNKIITYIQFHSKADSVKPDGFNVYCINMSGLTLLKLTKANEDIDNYKLEDLIDSTYSILKNLKVLEFYLILKEHGKGNVAYFQTYRYFVNRGFIYKAKGYFNLTKGNISKNYILEVVTNDDVSLSQDTKFTNKLIKLERIVTNWNINYVNIPEPTIIFLAESHDIIPKVCEMCLNLNIKNFRVCTYDNIKNGISQSLYKYDDEKQKIVLTKVSLFNG